MKNVTRISVLAVCMMAATNVSATEHAGKASPSELTGSDLVYAYDEMFDFDIDAWLSKHAPHLKPYSEMISHWAGYSGISPKVLIALMEQQTGVVTGRAMARDALQQPFGPLSNGRDFNAQMEDVAVALRQALYDKDDAMSATAQGRVALADGNPLEILRVAAGENVSEAAFKADGEFQQVYGRLFNERRQSQRGPEMGANEISPQAASYLQFPFPRGQEWHVGGAHTNTGSGSYPLSSLDMSRGGGWGSYQGNTWVVASAGGRFKRHSSCSAEVVHDDGVSTTYYHMANLQYGTGDWVNQNAAIGNPANNRAQALCNGGQSTGPHQHWSVKVDGSFYHLNGVALSDYTINASGNSYDTNCNRFYLVRNGYKYCAGWYYSD